MNKAGFIRSRNSKEYSGLDLKSKGCSKEGCTRVWWCMCKRCDLRFCLKHLSCCDLLVARLLKHAFAYCKPCWVQERKVRRDKYKARDLPAIIERKRKRLENRRGQKKIMNVSIYNTCALGACTKPKQGRCAVCQIRLCEDHKTQCPYLRKKDKPWCSRCWKKRSRKMIKSGRAAELRSKIQAVKKLKSYTHPI